MQDVTDTPETLDYNKRLKEAFNDAMTAEGWRQVDSKSEYCLDDPDGRFSIILRMTKEGRITGDMTIQPSEGDPISVSGQGYDTKEVFSHLSNACALAFNDRNASEYENAPKM